MNTPLASKPEDFEQSAAGEEDPGSAIDVAITSGGRATMRPGDEAAAATPGTGEDICPDCGGSGQRAGRDCAMCQGTGKVTAGIGGA